MFVVQSESDFLNRERIKKGLAASQQILGRERRHLFDETAAEAPLRRDAVKRRRPLLLMPPQQRPFLVLQVGARRVGRVEPFRAHWTRMNAPRVAALLQPVGEDRAAARSSSTSRMAWRKASAWFMWAISAIRARHRPI